MNANEMADLMILFDSGRIYEHAEEIADMLRNQQALIENLNGRIERMIENASHHEGIAHAGGFEQGHEVGRQLGMKQERALWNLSSSTQEIMDTHPTELTDDEIMKIWGEEDNELYYSKWAFIEFARAILRKVQEK